jgi:hypothetical protein
MLFTKHLRDGIRSGRIRCSVRIWMHPRVKVGGHYRMEEGQIVVDSIDKIRLADISQDLARESGFGSVKDLLAMAKHGAGNNVYLVRFHYLTPGGWAAPQSVNGEQARARTPSRAQSPVASRSELLRRIRGATPVRSRRPKAI